MEILVAIAGKLAEYTVEPVGRQVGYLAHYKSNHQNLQTKLEDLGAARVEVEHKVDQVKRSGQRIETSVQNWMTRVEAIITEASTFLKDGRHAQTECLHGFCPNLALRYQLSKTSTKLVEEIVQLHGKKEFPNFAYDVLPQEVCLLSTGNYNAFNSRNSIVTSVLDELRSPDTEMILVYGIGGVGKTTIVEQVLRQAKHDNLFDDVVMVRDVKQNPDHEKIQKEIAKKLGLSIVENDTLADRAPKLCDRIKDKRTLVVLDDVWEKIDLVAIGLPRLVNCKLVLTCRSRKELSLDMRTQKDVSLDVLNEEEAWSLFEKMAGDVVKDSRIRSVAMEVAKKCGGLPVLIVTVARALKDRNKLHAWKDTLRRLSGFDKEELTEKAYLALEWSYDQLEDKELKPLFLLCGTIVVKNHIYLEHLCKYGMGLGLFKNVNTIEQARDLLGTLVEKLIDSCLLLVSDSNMYFRMHDLVCEVAGRIASRDQHALLVGYGGELKAWPDKDFFKKCSKMFLESSNIPMLSEVPRECPKLEMFFLYSTTESEKSVENLEIPSNFFSEMEKLKVLGLAKLDMLGLTNLDMLGLTKLNILSLPSSLQFLKNLQTLCLEQCELGDIALVGHLSNLEILSFARSNIKQLPKEIGQLIRLRWLDLSDCEWLRVISPDVISRLERLEVLTMRNSFHKWDAERGGSNASLSELKLLSQLTALEIYISDADILPTNLFSNKKLVRYQIYIGDAWKKIHFWEKTMAETTLNTLKFKLTTSNELDQGLKRLLKRCEDLSLDGTESVNSFVYQSDIQDFQQLKHLHLQNNVDFTHMIDRKVKFPSLEKLKINELRKLQTIWNNQLVDQDSFRRLGEVNVCKCKSLQKIFTASVARGLQELYTLTLEDCGEVEEIIVDEEGLESLETTPPLFVFPKVTDVTFYNMPKLSRFYPGMHASKWPLLKNLDVSKCDNVKMFAVELPIFGEKYALDSVIEQSLFLINKDSFPNLEIVRLGVAEIWFGPSPAPFFSKLKSICLDKCAPFSKQALLFFEKLQNLDTLKVCGNDSEEIFAQIEEMKSGGEMERHAVGTLILPHVKHLELFTLPNLLHLGNHNSQPAVPLFPNLERLRVFFCHKLKSVESSTISFCNLTTLTVSKCGGLEYLTSYSVAKSLMQLTTLEVWASERLKEIIDASNEDDHCEISFSRLRLLSLRELPSLQGFCSGNCIVKLPSSTKLEVNCPIGLKISSQGVLLSNSKPKPTEEVDDDDGENEKDNDHDTIQ